MNLLNRFLLLSFCIASVLCVDEHMETKMETKSVDESVGRMIEEGRTLVHHAMKRFMIILPAIFFKLGIAFTMLILVTIVSVNNGFIGFLLLVVGLSSVLSRFQDTRSSAVVPYHTPVVAYHRRYQDWDRNDKGMIDATTKSTTQTYSAYSNGQYVYNPLSTYNPSYYGRTI